MARPPGIIDRVNYVVRFLEDPCDAPWMVYIETAIPPAGRLLLAWFSFGLDDVLRGFFRPKGLRSGRHGRRGRRGGVRPGRLTRLARNIPGLGDDVGNFIGKRLPGAERARGRQVSQGVKSLWIIDNRLQRLLLWWFVADIVSTFLYEWASALQRSEFCQKSMEETTIATGTGGAAAAIQGWVAVEAPTITRTTGVIDWLTSTATFPAGQWIAIVGFKNKNTGTLTHQQQMRLIRPGTPPEVIAITDPVTVEPGGVGELVVTADLAEAGQVTVEQKIDVGFSEGESADVFLGGRETP